MNKKLMPEKNKKNVKIHYLYKNNNPFLFYHHSINEVDANPLIYENETHPGYEILYLISGTVNYIIEGKSYIVNKGDIIIINSSEVHKLIIDLSTKYERCVLHFSNDVFPANSELNNRLIHDIILRTQNSLKIIPGDVVKKFKIDEIFLEFDKYESDSDKMLIPCLFASNIIKLFVQLNKALPSISSLPTPQINNPFIKKISDYITENISKKFKIKDIANYIHFSESRLSHLFKETMGITLNKYIILKRIQHAQNLIKHGMTLQEAAFESGYQYYSNFYNNYKMVTGETPSYDNISKW